MARYEITGTATDVFSLAEITQAITTAGAKRVNQRHAFGWGNQPLVATFRAEDGQEAKRICDAARATMRPDLGSLPSLLPWKYAE